MDELVGIVVFWIMFMVLIDLPFTILRGILIAPMEGQWTRGSEYKRDSNKNYSHIRKRRKINAKYEYID